MIDESREAYIIELSPGAYWLQSDSGRHRIVSVGYASLATPIQKGSPAYDLVGFSREAFPLIRVVKILITVREVTEGGLTN